MAAGGSCNGVCRTLVGRLRRQIYAPYKRLNRASSLYCFKMTLRVFAAFCAISDSPLQRTTHQETRPEKDAYNSPFSKHTSPFHFSQNIPQPHLQIFIYNLHPIFISISEFWRTSRTGYDADALSPLGPRRPFYFLFTSKLIWLNVEFDTIGRRRTPRARFLARRDRFRGGMYEQGCQIVCLTLWS